MTLLVAPHVLAVAPDEQPNPELIMLRHAANAGHEVGVAVVPSQFEEALYRLNNLPAQLRRIYAELDPADPDEDILEEFEEEAVNLVQGAVLLEEAVDAFYDAVAQFAFPLIVRFAGTNTVRSARDRRHALLSIKGLYASAWTFERLEERLLRTHSLAITPEHVLLHEPAKPAPNSLVSELQRGLVDWKIKQVFVNRANQIVWITYE